MFWYNKRQTNVLGGIIMDRIDKCISVYLVDSTCHILKGKLINSCDDSYFLCLDNGTEIWANKDNVYFTLEDAFFARVQAV